MSQASKKTVLIVDDEADTVRFLAMALEDAGFEVMTASHGVEAIEKVKEKTPDLISLDIVMPKGGGVRCFRELQKNPEWSKIPVIVVTAHARDDTGRADLQEMTMSGPGVYLEKPVTAESYVHAIRKVLGMDEPAGEADASDLKAEAKSLIESADPEALKKIIEAMKKDKK
ncbi:MAG: response regulator [Planctomycetes bacterium]|nr:response regulator [Planctomycetota bacterium]